MIASSKRDRNHRIPKKKAVLLQVGGPCGIMTRNHRVYPESVVREAMRKANFDCNDNDPQWSQVYTPTIENVRIRIDQRYSTTPPFKYMGSDQTVSWSIRGFGNHPNK